MATRACKETKGATVISEPIFTPQKKTVIANDPAIPASDMNIKDFSPALPIDGISFRTKTARTIEPKKMA